MSNSHPEHSSDDAARTDLPAEPVAETGETIPHEDQVLESQVAALLQRGRNGANWFYWVAALSLVNSVVMLSGGETFFVIGLGVTLFFDAMATGIAQQAPEAGAIVKGIAFALDLLVAVLVAGAGWLAGKRYQAVFAVAMGLYLLDGLIFLLFQDWMSVAFHGYALFCMWSGFSASRQLNAMQQVPLVAPAAAPAE